MLNKLSRNDSLRTVSFCFAPNEPVFSAKYSSILGSILEYFGHNTEPKYKCLIVRCLENVFRKCFFRLYKRRFWDLRIYKKCISISKTV